MNIFKRDFIDFEITFIEITFTIACLILTFILIDAFVNKPESFTGIVIDKHYKASSSSTGTGYGMGSNGKSGIIVMSQHSSEEFVIMVKTNNTIITVECDATIYYSKEIGNTIECIHKRGFFTNLIWESEGIK